MAVAMTNESYSLPVLRRLEAACIPSPHKRNKMELVGFDRDLSTQRPTQRLARA
jgi:hypothetical protein